MDKRLTIWLTVSYFNFYDEIDFSFSSFFLLKLILLGVLQWQRVDMKGWRNEGTEKQNVKNEKVKKQLKWSEVCCLLEMWGNEQNIHKMLFLFFLKKICLFFKFYCEQVVCMPLNLFIWLDFKIFHWIRFYKEEV